jgi:(R)-2-hydroxyacyl-CoA dehydratese activating ATPase
MAGDLGVVLVGLVDYRAENRHLLISEKEDMAHEEQMAADKACIPGCRGVPEFAIDPREKQPVAGKLKSLISSLQNHF